MLIILTAALLVSVSVETLRKNKVLPVAFATGAAAFLLLILFNTFVYSPQMTFDGNIYNIKAQITDYPEQKYGNYYYPTTVVSANGKEVKIKTRIVLNSPADVEPYDYIEGNFKFYRLGQSSDDILAYYKSSGTYLGAYSSDDEYSIDYIEDAQKPLISKVTELRSFIKKSVYRILPNEYGSLAVALLLGDKSGLSDETNTMFNNAGVTHILCVSGLHLSIWGLMILKILRKIGLSQRLSAGITMIPVVLLMLVTGMNYSVIRSGIMMLVFLLSDILLKQRDSLNSLGFALTAMSVADPFSMGSVGLQLSALSTLGIILCSRYLMPDIRESFEKIKAEWIKNPLFSFVNAFLITSSAVVFTLPVSAELSSGFSFAVFPSNLLTVWAAGYAMVFSAIGALIGNISVSFFNLPGFLGGLLCKYIIKCIDFINSFEFLRIRISNEKLYISMLAVIIFTFFSFIISRGNRKFKAISVSLCGVIFVFSFLVSSYYETAEMRATAIDVGNGTAVFVTYKGNNILVGCDGTADMLYNRIAEVIEDNGNKLDELILFNENNEESDKIINNFHPEEISSDENNFSLYDEIYVDVEKSNEGYAVLFETKQGSILVVNSPSVDMKELPQKFSDSDIIISRSDIPKNSDKNSVEFVVVNSEKIRGKYIENCLANEGVKCISTGVQGNVTVRCRDGFYTFERT